MTAGEPYDAGAPELAARRKTAQALMRRYNQTILGDDADRAEILATLLGRWNGAVIRPPFYVDYGCNIRFGAGVFLNYGCVILDVCPVTIGAATQIGPMVQILTADHPRDAGGRERGHEFGRAIGIGANVWIGGGAILLPGVTVGDHAVIGAGAVVTRDVAANVTVAGNPARPLSGSG